MKKCWSNTTETELRRFSEMVPSLDPTYCSNLSMNNYIWESIFFHSRVETTTYKNDHEWRFSTFHMPKTVKWSCPIRMQLQHCQHYSTQVIIKREQKQLDLLHMLKLTRQKKWGDSMQVNRFSLNTRYWFNGTHLPPMQYENWLLKMQWTNCSQITVH